MAPDVAIHRFQARHRVPDEGARRLALDAQARLLDGELEAALARVAAPGEVVLLKRLSARVRISRRGSDRDNARAWSDALAASLQQALLAAASPELLRFASRQQALRAFVADALRGSDARDWAWQRLALLPATRSRANGAAARRQALLRLLADDADDSVPLLRSLLAGGDWAALIAQLHEGELRGLAHAVLARLAGASAAAFADAPPPQSAPSAGEADVAPPQAAAREDDTPRWLSPTALAAGGGERTRWALRLAAMLAQPALARRGAAAVDAQLRAWTAAPAAPTATASNEREGTAAPGAQVPPPAPRATDAAATARPQPIGQRPAAHTPSVQSAPATRDAAPPLAGDGADAEAPPLTAGTGPQAPAVETLEASGRTDHGGLLYLLPLLPLCGALPLLEDAALWPALPQALHALALRLWPMRDDDPAALAFCGLTPLQPPPPALQEASPQQAAALQRAQDLLLAHLTERLPDWRGPALLARVLCRPARIVADPGWIDVVFPLRDVALELRRAALDLDPGFLSWLGVVLRYRYE